MSSSYFLVFGKACKFGLYSSLLIQFVVLCSDVFVSFPVLVVIKGRGILLYCICIIHDGIPTAYINPVVS